MTAAYRTVLGELPGSSDDHILGRLAAWAADTGFATHYHRQTDAWQHQIQFLRRFAADCCGQCPSAKAWTVYFEFEIPRRGKRPDVVLLADDLIFVLEFKVGAEEFLGTDEWQVLSYALDLRDFHVGSSGRTLVPVLIASHAPPSSERRLAPFGQVHSVARIADSIGSKTAEFICSAHSDLHDPQAVPIGPTAWETSPYRPTPTIIEAAQTLFAGHGVADISHSFASNLDVTSGELIRAIERAQQEKKRIICFVTGLPGAGKTLAGLNAVHDPTFRSSGRPAGVFLSGNGPLVKIVREALVRDQHQRGLSLTQARRLVGTFIDNVHGFIKTYGIERTTERPYESAIVFDEAQRAWNAREVCKKHSVDRSEPALVLDIMERAENWAAVIALVGGGQEIHTGEAGLAEWGRALGARSSPWEVWASPEVLAGGDAVAGHRLFDQAANSTMTVVSNSALHLATNVRSPRDRLLGNWVNSLLFPDVSSIEPQARSDEFPIVLTRDLAVARQWLRRQSEGIQRAGLLASSGALRLRHHGIEVSKGFRDGYPYADWFLGPPNDFRSSSWLEVAATEFECQGLELDWCCICWGGDLVIGRDGGSWTYRTLRGNKWRHVRKAETIRYTLNKYRVLLTRARKGMVIWIPKGDESDSTREPQLFDSTAAYLLSRGVTPL